MTHSCILKATGLNKSYGSKKVINDLELNINRGDIYGFLGPNGAGKTTTIKILLGLVRYNSGSVNVMGYDIRKNFKAAIKKVGAVVETPRFYENYNAYDNLKMIKNLHGDVNENKIYEVLDIVGLNKRIKDRVETYSLGMKQRLGIARALINDPELIILDEPTNGLDPQGMKEIREMIKHLAVEKNITFFISTHLLNEVELVCNKVGIIKNGTKVAEGYVNELLNDEYELLDIVVDNEVKALEILKQVSQVKSIITKEKCIKVEVEKGSSGFLSSALVNGNVTLKYLIPKSQSLEDYFIEKTKGGEHIV